VGSKLNYLVRDPILFVIRSCLWSFLWRATADLVRGRFFWRSRLERRGIYSLPSHLSLMEIFAQREAFVAASRRHAASRLAPTPRPVAFLAHLQAK